MGEEGPEGGWASWDQREDGQGETRRGWWVGELGPEVRWVSRNQRVGRRAGTRGQVGKLGPEGGGWASWDQREDG